MDDVPKMDYEISWFLKTFRVLDSNRVFGTPISMTDYLSYFKMFDALYELDVVVPVLMELDREYTKKVRANAESER